MWAALAPPAPYLIWALPTRYYAVVSGLFFCVPFDLSSFGLLYLDTLLHTCDINFPLGSYGFLRYLRLATLGRTDAVAPMNAAGSHGRQCYLPR